MPETETMRTLRLVADTEHGPCCIDVVLRGPPEAVEATELTVSRFLNLDPNIFGHWVDTGTTRQTVTLAVS